MNTAFVLNTEDPNVPLIIRSCSQGDVFMTNDIKDVSVHDTVFWVIDTFTNTLYYQQLKKSAKHIEVITRAADEFSLVVDEQFLVGNDGPTVKITVSRDLASGVLWRLAPVKYHRAHYLTWATRFARMSSCVDFIESWMTTFETNIAECINDTDTINQIMVRVQQSIKTIEEYDALAVKPYLEPSVIATYTKDCKRKEALMLKLEQNPIFGIVGGGKKK